MRTVLLTSESLRHRHAAAVLERETELVGVVMERKAPAVEGEASLPEADRAVLRRHFSDRDATETRLLGGVAAVAADTLRVARGEVNGAVVDTWVNERRPDVIVLFGTGLIRDPLLARWHGRMVNLHLGLSPYYRGAATNFWPLVLNEPECVGATIHLAAAAVDAGDVLGQVRPVPRPEDDAHALGTRTIVAGVAALPSLIERFLCGRVVPRPQTGAGRVFRRRDFTADAVRRLWRNLEQGMMARYCASQAERQARYPIVEVAA